LKKFILSSILYSFCLFAFGQSQEDIAIQLANANPQSKHFDQLVVVYNQNSADANATLVGLEKKKGKWLVQFKAIKASVGRNGVAEKDSKIEGDGKSPKGIFELGRLFGYEELAPTSINYTQTTSEDKWIDDAEAADYNTYVRGNTTAKSFEHLKLNSIDYKYCMVIEYNTKPVVKGKGSAIFFHVADEKYTPTSGCVAIAENDMLNYLQWLMPGKKRGILLTSLNNL
jgi:L,D-peptidoglycan transpeptidase YkuD (ErfK/YbiS/YcfS/YnhG family)